jgi:hypothetical protein
MRLLTFAVVAATCVLVFLGCGRQNLPKDLPPLYRQGITITQEGQPLAWVGVGLHPVEESKWNAGSVTDASGTAEMRTHGRYRGVPAGKYKVTLSKEDSESKSLGIRNGTEAFQDIYYSLVELKYLQPETTPLEIEITKKNAPVTFEIGPPVRVFIGTN